MSLSEREPCGSLDAPQSGRCKTVFVHGFLGWGERDELYRLLPYWGLACGDILSFLRERGYDCAAASAGPISSCWDRACELYAELTGGTADYGEAHSRKAGHARYGVSYEKPLAEVWDEQHKIDLVGHSFGGNTIRLFLDILANGRPDEVRAARDAGTKPSPFFEGGRGGCVRSLSAIASPHNGTTLMYSSEFSASAMVGLFTACAKALGISDFKGVYDYQLDQFGFCRSAGESLADSVSRMLGAQFLSRGDHAMADLTADACGDFNKTMELLPDVYYFSYPACRTHQSLTSYDQTPDLGMTPLLAHYAAGMGRCRGSLTPAGTPLGREWQPNDGLVNTLSAMYPRGDAFTVRSAAPFSPGVWNVSPVRHMDHLEMIGGVFNASPEAVRKLYLNVMENIYSTYETKS